MPSLKYTIDHLFTSDLPVAIGLPAVVADTPSFINNGFGDATGGMSLRDTEVGGSLQSPNFVTGLGGSGWKIGSDGNFEANDGTFRGDLIAGTFRTATSGERIQINVTANRLELINSSDSIVASLFYGTGVQDPILSIAQADDTRRGIQITATAADIIDHSIHIANAANADDSFGINIDRDGNDTGTVFGIAVNAQNTGAGSAIAGDFGGPTGLRVTGASVWGLDITTTGGGVTVTQTGSSINSSFFANNDSSNTSSYGLQIDRDANVGGSIFGMVLNCDNANGNATGLDVGVGSTSGTSRGLRITSADIGIQLTAPTKVFEFSADATAAGAYAGRVPIDVGGNTKYLHYYDA